MENPSLLETAAIAAGELRWQDVEVASRQELKQNPHSAEAVQLLARSLSNTGRQLEAANMLTGFLENAPHNSSARLILASLLWGLGRYRECAEQCRRLLREDPENAHLWNSCGLCFTALGRIEEALPCLRQAAVLKPEVYAFQLNLGQALEQVHKPALAAQAYWAGLQLEPRSADCLRGLAKAYFILGVTDEAQKAINALAQLRELRSDDQLLQCDIFLLKERAQDAIALVEPILKSDPGNSKARLIKAVALQQIGRHEDSVVELNEAIKIDPDFATPYLHLTQSRRFGKADQALIDQMVRLSEKLGEEVVDGAIIRFALGKAYDDQKEYERAMANFDSGHRILKALQTREFQPETVIQLDNRLIATFTKEFFVEHRLPSLATELPVFIVGLPRSGTTLTETILSSHPGVHAGGENPFWIQEGLKAFSTETLAIDEKSAWDAANRYLAIITEMADGANRVTDKLPQNTQNVGLLHALFPNARFVHCRRHPVDNCLSFYMNMFAGADYVHDKAQIVSTYREYARLMAHWRNVLPVDRLFELDYEELISNQETVTRNLVAFCGLEWDDACLRPEMNDRMISTASHWQARQPLYKGSVERWRNYEPWLGEFRELLELPPPR